MIEQDKSKIKFETLLTRCIYDDIHGFVKLTAAEKELLSTPYLRRLHFIKQNALANFIFPGATHTRFSHSIGVLHIVEKMVQQLKKVQTKIVINEFDHQIIRLAALLHDVGHYPLSHTIEDCFQKFDQYFLQKKDEGFNPLENVPMEENNLFMDINSIHSLLNDFPENTKTSDFHHEKIAKILISNTKSPLYKVLKKLLSGVYSQLYEELISNEDLDAYLHLIGQIICGKPKFDSNPLLNNSSEMSDKYFILSLLINSDLDADQMDYMLRDTKNTGIQTTIRTDFLINNMNICFINLGENKNQPVLCFNYRAFESVQQFIFSKAYWYTEIILYDKVSILNEIAKKLYLFWLYKESPIKNIDDFYNKILFDEEKYIAFTDADFWQKMSILKEKYSNNTVIIKMINILQGYRPIPKVVALSELRELKLENQNVLKTNIDQFSLKNERKNEIYDDINKYFNNDNIFPICYSNKFFKPTLGEKTAHIYTNRSIYILLSPCTDENNCSKNCHKVVELTNSTKLGNNIIHKLLCSTEKTNTNQAFIYKCTVYDFT